MNEEMKVEPKIKDLIELIWEAIKQRRVLKFPFESEGGNSGDRDIKPYMVHSKNEKEIKVAGVPREFWSLPKEEQQKNVRHYFLEKIDIRVVRILSETFDDPGVPRKIVVKTTTAEVICRFIYNDEDIEEVMKSWVKIEGLDLR
jgi:hypothetical protein